KHRAQTVVIIKEMLRNYPRLGEDRHEVRIPIPAGHYVPVKMVLDAGAGGASEIHPDVETPGSECAGENIEREFQQFTEIAVFHIRERGEHFFVPFGRDQEMAVVIGVLVEHDHGVHALRQDQFRPRILSLRLLAEDAACRLFFRDVGHPPRRPELVHSVPSGTGLPSTRRRNSFPTLKKGSRFAATETISPLFGLRPSRARRCLTTKLPKPRISMRSPCPIASTIASKMALTITSESRCDR